VVCGAYDPLPPSCPLALSPLAFFFPVFPPFFTFSLPPTFPRASARHRGGTTRGANCKVKKGKNKKSGKGGRDFLSGKGKSRTEWGWWQSIVIVLVFVCIVLVNKVNQINAHGRAHAHGLRHLCSLLFAPPPPFFFSWSHVDFDFFFLGLAFGFGALRTFVVGFSFCLCVCVCFCFCLSERREDEGSKSCGSRDGEREVLGLFLSKSRCFCAWPKVRGGEDGGWRVEVEGGCTYAV
jgi:hypothetical protein